MWVSSLRWDDVAPSRHTYDARAAERVVGEVVALAVGGDLASRTLARGWDVLGLEHAITQALVSGLGAWTCGFRSHRSSGGPVTRYCCARHSVLPQGDADARATIGRVLAGLAEWRAYLVELEQTFEAIHARTRTLALERAVEHAAAELVAIVLARTGADDAWHATFTSALTWCVESFGGEPSPSLAVTIDQVVCGHFSSWVVPSHDAQAEAATELGLAVAIACDATTQRADTPDALAAWRSIRERIHGAGGHPVTIPIAWDGHRRFIEGRETARDAPRARRMSVALDAARAAARKGSPLDLALLRRLQGIALGDDATLRTTDAYAKGGRERYGRDDATMRRFEGWLAQANDASTPCHVRAARVYLDVCFTHPFEDGNARAARLALDFVLAREGYLLRAVEPLFTLSRAADDAEGARALARLVSYFMARG